MATAEEVKKLAALARITVTEEELPGFVKEFDAILAYVSKLDALTVDDAAGGTKPLLKNVMRLDGEPHESGKYTEKIAEQFSGREGDALKVKQIITHD